MSPRWVMKYDVHKALYGVYDRNLRRMFWLGDKAAAASAASRLNALDETGAQIQGAIHSINTTLTGTITPAQREALTGLRGHLREIGQQHRVLLADVEFILLHTMTDTEVAQ